MTLPAIALHRRFFALADPTRLRILELLSQAGTLTVSEVCSHFAVSRFAVMKHLNVLEECGLITREAAGRERRVALAHDWREALVDWLRALRLPRPR